MNRIPSGNWMPASNQYDIDNQYLKALATPSRPMDYDKIFDRAMANVLSVWSSIANAVFRNDNAYLIAINNWNLDTGKDASNRCP